MEAFMKSAPYGLPQFEPSLLRNIPLFSASVMPEKGFGIGTHVEDQVGNHGCKIGGTAHGPWSV